MLVALPVLYTSCKKSDFADSYADPSKISVTTVEKQYTGFLNANRDYVLPSYWNYFVVLRTSLNRWTQSVGWENALQQYIPPASGVSDRWNNFFSFVAQFRELENVFNKQAAADQADRRIYMITALIYFYDHTEKVVDLHGGIPWADAGKLSANGGNYGKSLPKYDDAAAIYTKMLDDLKGFADELSTANTKSGILTGFKTQDIINKGSITAWQKYCNSLRLRMLTRVSGVAAFQARVNAEIAAIVGNPAKYPVVSANSENIQINVFNLSTDINAKGFKSGLEDWNGNIAGKVMIDHMKTNGDPRLRAVFEPGANAPAGVYNGLDQMSDAATQNALIAGGTIAIYNRSTLSRNQYFPGVLINAAEVSFLLSEYYLNANNMTAAKAAYVAGIKQSVEYYYLLRTVSNDNTSGTLIPTNDVEVNAYIASPAVNWDLADRKSVV